MIKCSNTTKTLLISASLFAVLSSSGLWANIELFPGVDSDRPAVTTARLQPKNTSSTANSQADDRDQAAAPSSPSAAPVPADPEEELDPVSAYVIAGAATVFNASADFASSIASDVFDWGVETAQRVAKYTLKKTVEITETVASSVFNAATSAIKATARFAFDCSVQTAKAVAFSAFKATTNAAKVAASSSFSFLTSWAR